MTISTWLYCARPRLDYPLPGGSSAARRCLRPSVHAFRELAREESMGTTPRIAPDRMCASPERGEEQCPIDGYFSGGRRCAVYQAIDWPG